MNLAKMTNKNLIVLDVSVATKEEAIRLLIDKLYKENIISSKEKFFDTVMEREKHSPTGLERGLAIPHGKCDSVNRSAFAVARLNNKINDWESIDESNEVDLVFLLAIPKSEKEITHLKLLSELSVALMDENFYNDLSISKNADEFLKNLNRSDKEEKDTNKYNKTVLVVTACAAGIAHTYMSAEALEKAGKEMGIKVISEKQGASGIEDRHTKEQIQKADGVIFACDVAVKNIERYQGKSFVKVRVAEPLKHSKNLLNKVLQNPDGKVEVLSNEEAFTSTYESKQGTLKEMMEAVMTGISYMIPVIVSAGLMMGIAKLTAVAIGQIDNMGTFIESGNAFYELLGYLDMFGGMIFKFIYPIFSAYVAYSIADRPALVPGLIGGAFAGGLHFTFWGVEGGVPSGFIGALILGLVAGYVTRFLNENIKLNKNLQAMKPMFLLPGITMLVIFLLNFYAVDPAFGRVNAFIANIIESFGTASTIALTVVIAACTAFDLGGPVNKAAGAIAIGLAADGVFPLTARVLSIVIPPIGLGLATVLDKIIVKRRVFDDNLRVVGNSSIILGLIAVSEGAIPFMLKNPLITIPINILGAIIGSITAVMLGAIQWNLLPATWGWPLVENLWAYLVGLIAGTLFIALANIFIRFNIIKKQNKNDINKTS
ncbi:fructose-specific PTS transporter subunit EIIC [Clostridioides difficile]|uniref:fructose-specific PTS transporter subunit EIIC n=1 Tax=Clostridioides difficile TaxID=1496 RepID=UPI000BB1C502|nr:fructose-specific PTS transporter subunit EIIC [Clostridioides difficile]EGT5270975.1 PTS fructose transporter subunit IIABC [Clostridioides difficile]EGT5470398.1 PTS fructose transporter subunit IIABC [Clostridioides difficile]MBH8089651.1 PTS sugar transporter subunit IIA [Clostridioides difficile]MBY1610811.1 fructose-specific PTS transporter subunit EIIC [Clostridioides difficile]MBY2466743.1 fructose-specific PTS transporter subunit EIIC [Clostridioides difficile]